MKKYLLIILISILTYNVFGQGYKIVAIAQNGKKDSVRFGFRDNATIGIDAHLGEINITNQPIGEVDIRVVQRDSMNFSCTYTFDPLRIDTFKHFFPINFDSKINFRKMRDTSFINRIFEVKFFSKNIIQIQIWPEPLATHAILDSLDFFIDSCLNKINLASFSYDPRNPFPINIRGGSILSNFTFIFRKGFVLPIKENSEINPKIYPNPCQNTLNIDLVEPKKVKEIAIFDILGRQVFKQSMDYSALIELDIGHLNRGTYFISAFDEHSKRLFSKLIVKE